MPVIVAEILEQEAVNWLENVTGESLDSNKTFQENLKDGTVLCKAFNICFTEFKVKYTHSAMPFKQMENIATFLHAISKLPTFRSFDLFSTVDLYEGKNLAQVVRCILACKRFADREAVRKGLEELDINTANSVIEPEVFVNKKQQDQHEDKVKNIIINSESECDDCDESEIESATSNAQDESFVLVEVIDNSESESVEVIDNSESENVEIIDNSDIEEAKQSTHNIFDYQTKSDLETEPEIVLIDSPLLESSTEDVNHRDSEEIETFTTDNPGTFEILMTD